VLAPPIRALAALALLGLAACGGSGIGGPTPTPGASTPTPGIGTPTPVRTPSTSPTSAGTPSVLPPIVKTGRVVFRSASGFACCVATDPALLPPDPKPGQPSLVLTNLPIGPATVVIDGYVEDFAPAPAGVVDTCATINTTGVKPCDPTRQASSAFDSDPLNVNIVGGVRVNLGAVDVSALPFVLPGFLPPQNSTVPLPIEFLFTVVDAATGIEEESVALDITLDVPEGEPPVFRSLTKRVPLELFACRDGGNNPCGPQGDDNLAGFEAQSNAEYLEYLPAGPVEARITAKNNANPPRDLDFRYVFVVAPDPSPTPGVVAAAADVDDSALVWLPTPTPTSTPVVE
jgi:hypothetical protein